VVIVHAVPELVAARSAVAAVNVIAALAVPELATPTVNVVVPQLVAVVVVVVASIVHEGNTNTTLSS